MHALGQSRPLVVVRPALGVQALRERAERGVVEVLPKVLAVRVVHGRNLLWNA
jgi:hypothetical protein